MNRKKNTAVIALSVLLILLLLALGGSFVYLLLRPGDTQRQTDSTQTESETVQAKASDDEGELYCEGIDEANIAFDEETGLQYADNQLLITASDGTDMAEIEELAQEWQAEIVGRIEVTNIYQLKFSQSYSKAELEAIGEELCNTGQVSSYEKNTVMDIDISAVYPNDSEWKNEWGDDDPDGSNWGMEAINAPEAWEYLDEMQDVNVGVYDNMFYDHEDLEFEDILCNMSGTDLNDSHGTHVSGTIAAIYNNKKGVAGAAPTAKLYGVSFTKIAGTHKYDDDMSVKVAFTYLIDQKKCKVINMSVGTPELTFGAAMGNANAINGTENLAQQISDYLQILLDVDEENDFVICKAAGNDNSSEQFVRADAGDADADYGYILYSDENKERYKKYKKEINSRLVTADTEGYVEAYDLISAISDQNIRDRILVVGAVENLGDGEYQIASFSNCGYNVDVVAPGVDICSTVGTDGYEGGWDGTSMATPHVAGVAAMCFAVNDELTGAQVVDIVKQTSEGSITYADDKSNGSRQFGGYPMVNAAKAVKKASETARNEDKETVVTRDVVLVLDSSGSMSGSPIEQTKEAATQFIDTVFEEDSRVSLVTYESSAEILCGLTDDQQELNESIENIYSGGSTNMYEGLELADELLDSSQADRKIIVLMSDGLPNEGENDYGDYSTPLVDYAEALKAKGYYIYTLGFFTYVSGNSLYEAQNLMEDIASPRLHYEVDSEDDLVFFFDDIAAQIGGTQYVYIRIACPVDVTVASGDETLTSKADSENTRTSFGSLTYETVLEEESEGDSDYDDASQSVADDYVKVLRLKMDEDYDVEIEGYDSGTMDYTVSFPNEDGEYDDVREFPDIEVTSSMQAVSNTAAGDATYLEVDEDGDGKTDTTYKTEANGEMEEVDEGHRLLYIALLVIAVLVILILVAVIIALCVSRKTKKPETVNSEIAGSIYGAFGIYLGRSFPMRRGQQCVVGRKSDCDIQLVHGEVSRVHCVIEMLPDGVYQVTDFSSNGTFYNNQRLRYREPYRLPRGAILAIGDADNVLELR